MPNDNQQRIWNLSDEDLIDELSALNGSERDQRMMEREALRRILQRLTRKGSNSTNN